jgi:probable rRNA maturation factor
MRDAKLMARGAAMPGVGPRVEVQLTSKAWAERLDAPAAIARAAALAMAEIAGAGAAAEISIVLADDDMVRGLNRAWRGQDTATNVLAFSSGEAAAGANTPHLLGDVVIAFGVAAAEAAAAGLELSDHLAHLVVHGVAHLLGFDHQTETEADAMEFLEATVLDRLGIDDPYRAECGVGGRAQ